MDNSRSNIIIIEGPQGVGKSTMANFVRDNLQSTNLYRLSGIKDKSITGKEKSKKMYLELINYMKALEESGLNLVFDRTFFSEEVYCKLGYKEYNFDNVYGELIKRLNDLNYNIYFTVLYLKDESIYENRLKRVHHDYQAFSFKSSIDQQDTYLKLADNIKYKNINVLKIATDNYDAAYNSLIKGIPVLKDNNVKYNI